MIDIRYRLSRSTARDLCVPYKTNVPSNVTNNVLKDLLFLLVFSTYMFNKTTREFVAYWARRWVANTDRGWWGGGCVDMSYFRNLCFHLEPFMLPCWDITSIEYVWHLLHVGGCYVVALFMCSEYKHYSISSTMNTIGRVYIIILRYILVYLVWHLRLDLNF